MPTLDDALEHLEALRDHPPSPAPPASEVHDRAHRLRSRRRGTRTVGLLAVAGLLAVGVAIGTDRDTTIQSGPSTTTTSPEPTITVEPSEDLRPNQLVTITLPPEADETNLIFAECGREATRSTPEAWCQVLALSPTESAGRYQVRVRRVISTTNGRIDCAEEPGRCVLGVRAGQDFTTPISFDPDLAPLAPPKLELTLASAALVTVTGEGYEPGVGVMVAQCRPGPVTGTIFTGCDRHRAVRVTADDHGAFTAQLKLHREVYEDYTGWAPCAPCQVQALTPTAETQAVDVDAAAGLAGRPTVEIRPAGPYQPGQVVELRGTGFAPNTSELYIGWCRFNTAHPETEAQGAGPEYAECGYPNVDQVIITDDQGRFTITGFPLPNDPFGFGGATCIGEAVRCGLAWHPGEGALPYFVTEFHLTTDTS